MVENDRQPGLSSQDSASSVSPDVSPAGSGLPEALTGQETVEMDWVKEGHVHGRGDSVTSKDGLLDEPYGFDSTKRRRLYSVNFAQTPSLSDDVIGYAKNTKRRVKSEISGWGVYDWFAFFLPILGWLPKYNWKRNLITDIIAGLSVGAMVVPQGMSYANLAGLPAVYGLYGAFVPVLVYSVLGSSRQLAVGPVAVTSLLLGSGLADTTDVQEQANPNKPANPQAQQVINEAAIQVAMLAGALYTAVGVFRLGWLTNFLSHSVIAGFMTGASVIIGLSQVKYILGIKIPRHDPVQEQLEDIFTNLDQFQWRVFLMGMSWLFILFLFKFLSDRYRRLLFLRSIGPITVTVLGIAIVNIWHLQKPPASIPVVGKIPKGLPDFTVGWWSPIDQFGSKLGLAVIVCLIDVLESVSIAKALAQTNKYRINPTQELIGLGVANLAGAAFNCYTTTGSFSRSAVNNLSGAKSQLSGTATGIFIMLVLLLLTPVFTNLPQSVQGAVVIAGVSSLFNYKEWWFLWKVNKFDWIVFNVAAICVMFLGVEKGLACAIGLSIVLVLWKVAFPKTAVLGRLPGTTVYRNKKQYPEAREEDEILIVRIDAPLIFANVIPIKDTLLKYEERARERITAAGGELRFVILDLSPVTDIDASAVHFLKDAVVEHLQEGVRLVLANPSRVVVHQIERAGLDKLIGREFIHVRMHEAVTYCKELMAEGQGGPAPPTDSVRREIGRASGEPHVGGVLGQGVLGLSRASQTQAPQEREKEDSLGSINEVFPSQSPASKPSAYERVLGVFRKR